MAKWWKNLKEKEAAEKIKKLEERALQYIQENEKLERLIEPLLENKSELSKQQENSETTETITDSVDKEYYTEVKKKTKKKLNKCNGHGHNRGEESPKKIRPDILEQDQSTYSVNERPVKRSRKRCHFCRKRGHLQKDCLSKRVLRRWLRDEAREMY